MYPAALVLGLGFHAKETLAPETSGERNAKEMITPTRIILAATDWLDMRMHYNYSIYRTYLMVASEFGAGIKHRLLSALFQVNSFKQDELSISRATSCLGVCLWT